MDKSQSSVRSAFDEMALCLRTRNQRYLDFLKESGDPADLRSKVLANIFDSAADGLIVLDENLTIVLANLAAAELAGWQLEDMTRSELRREYKFYIDGGKTPLPYDEEPIVVAIREKRAHEMIGFVVSDHLPPPGRWVRVHAAPIFDEKNEVLGGVSVFVDLTERLRLQRQRDCLAALITHDIKNHLAAEQMFLEQLHTGGNLSEADLRITAELMAASENFMRIADSLLGTFGAQLFVNEIAKPVEILLLLTRAIELTKLEAAKHQVHVELRCGAKDTLVCGLPDVLCHVFHNLIQNAIVASPSNSSVRIDASATANFVTVQVKDVGTGMTDSEVSSLFSPPEIAVKKMSKTMNSSGFGLYLSHMLLEGQGGSMTCESQPGQGTTLNIIPPIHPVSA